MFYVKELTFCTEARQNVKKLIYQDFAKFRIERNECLLYYVYTQGPVRFGPSRNIYGCCSTYIYLRIVLVL